MKVPETYFCDFCKKESPRYRALRLPVVTNCDWTEGRPTSARIEFEVYDICEKCLIEATNIRANFRNSEPTIIKNNLD